MNSEVLLHWMTHIQEGSWGMFRGAVAKLVDADADLGDIRRTLRIFLSDLGHADFFVDASQRWRIRAPVLAGLAGVGDSAVLTGGRTPTLLARVADAAAAHGCRLTIDSSADHPAYVRVQGSPGELAAAAAAAEVPYVENLARLLCASIRPIQHLIDSATVAEGPANWSIRSFDFNSFTWVEGLIERSACEFRSRYGPVRYYLHTRRGRLLRLPKREAVYAAAAVRELELATYDTAASTLCVPSSAPLPEAYARAASLCAGALSAFEGGRFCYRAVPRDVAGVLLVAAGQPYPGSRIAGSATTAYGDRPHGQSV